MPYTKALIIKEELAELKRLQKTVSAGIKPRIQMLILSKSKSIHSKYGLSTVMGVSLNTIQRWKSLYGEKGIEGLLKESRGGNRKSKIDDRTAAAIIERLSHAKSAPGSFKELQHWVSEHYIADIKYMTLHHYVKRKFGAKLKVARKTHVKKDKEKVEDFKKNSSPS